jgi:hypothetical protein
MTNTHMKEHEMKTTAPQLIRWAGLSAMAAGLIFAVVGLIHPPQVLSSVTTSTWTIVHCLTIAMSFFGLLGIAGLYARHAEAAGWPGLVGFLLLSLWFVLVTGFTFFEAFILPLLARDSPQFVASFLGIFTGSSGETSVGALGTLWSLLGVIYILGALLFGIATFRARILSRWAAGLLGMGAALSPAFALVPVALAPLAAVPVGLGLAWLGYALWSERRMPAAQLVAARGPRAAAALLPDAIGTVTLGR